MQPEVSTVAELLSAFCISCRETASSQQNILTRVHNFNMPRPLGKKYCCCHSMLSFHGHVLTNPIVRLLAGSRISTWDRTKSHSTYIWSYYVTAPHISILCIRTEPSTKTQQRIPYLSQTMTPLSSPSSSAGCTAASSPPTYPV